MDPSGDSSCNARTSVYRRKCKATEVIHTCQKYANPRIKRVLVYNEEPYETVVWCPKADPEIVNMLRGNLVTSTVDLIKYRSIMESFRSLDTPENKKLQSEMYAKLCLENNDIISAGCNEADGIHTAISKQYKQVRDLKKKLEQRS